MRTWVYFIQCDDDCIYIGVASDPIERFKKHAAGSGAYALRLRKPIALLGAVDFPTRTEALRCEYRLKRLRRSEKLQLALIASRDVAWLAFRVAQRSPFNAVGVPTR